MAANVNIRELILILCRRSRRGPKFTTVPAQESQDEDKEGGDLSTGVTFTSRSSKYNCSTTRQGRPSWTFILSALVPLIIMRGVSKYYRHTPHYTALHSTTEECPLFIFIFYNCQVQIRWMVVHLIFCCTLVLVSWLCGGMVWSDTMNIYCLFI